MFAFAFYKNMDSILWASGLFAADANQWKERSSIFKSFNQESVDISIALTNFQDSIAVIFFYGGALNSVILSQTAFRFSLRNIDTWAKSSVFLPLIYSNGEGTNVGIWYFNVSNSKLQFRINNTSVRGAFSVHIFDPT